MAYILPEAPEFANQAEREVYEFFKNNLTNDCVCYFNYNLQPYEFDILLLVPNWGFAIVEIKGWQADKIIRVVDNNRILYRQDEFTNIPLPSPLKQADRYRYQLVNIIKEEFDLNILGIPLVWYPYISHEEYSRLRLDILSGKEVTFFQEDLVSSNYFERLHSAFNLYDNMPHNNFDKDNEKKIRLLFETREQIDNHMNWQRAEQKYELPINEICKIDRTNIARNYSVLSWLGELNGSELQAKVDFLIEQWQKGTTVYVLCNSTHQADFIQDILNKTIGFLGLTNKDFKIENFFPQNGFITFNFQLHVLEESDNEFFSQNPFDLFDGVDAGDYDNFLKWFNDNTGFNYVQYKIENADLKKNIRVIAGAGTGKTTSMVSRIIFLIYKELLNRGIAVDEVKKLIYMMTFTNDAAEEMKSRLQQRLYNTFLLTNDYVFIELAESIESVNICTIHKMTRKILQRYAPLIGVGSNMTVDGGIFERREILRDVLEEYLSNDNEVKEWMYQNGLRMYDLRKKLMDFMGHIHNKSIDVFDSSYVFNHSDTGPKLACLIEEIVKEVEIRYREKNEERNKVALGELTSRLMSLVKNDKEKIIEYEQNLGLGNQDFLYPYLFIDEFQDTDDVQIELIKAFQTIFSLQLFVVGDPKQCIYRFRGAGDEAFKKISQGIQMRKYELQKNYRTDRRLLDKFDKVFIQCARKSTGPLGYSAKDKLIGQRYYSNIDENDLFNYRNYNGDSTTEFENKFLDALEECMVKVNEENGRKKSTDNKEQIAILVRTNEEVDNIRRICKEAGIEVDTETGGDLYRLQPTVDLYKLVLAFENNQDPKYLYNLLDTPYCGNHNLFRSDFVDNIDIDDRIAMFGERSGINFENKTWDKYTKMLRYNPPLTVLKDFVENSKPWQRHALDVKDLDIRRDKQIKYRRFLEQLTEKLTSVGKTEYLSLSRIRHFLDINVLTWQEQATIEPFKSSAKLLCTTVHKSKGLEYHTVIMPFCNFKTIKGVTPVAVMINENNGSQMIEYFISWNNFRGKLQSDNYRDVEREDRNGRSAEEMRILYVAMTRAKKRLLFLNDTACQETEPWQEYMVGGGQN